MTLGFGSSWNPFAQASSNGRRRESRHEAGSDSRPRGRPQNNDNFRGPQHQPSRRDRGPSARYAPGSVAARNPRMMHMLETESYDELERFTGADLEELERIAKCLSNCAAIAREYVSKVDDVTWTKSVTKGEELCQLGRFVRAPVVERQYDNRVDFFDLTSIPTPSGRVIEKDRPQLVLEKGRYSCLTLVNTTRSGRGLDEETARHRPGILARLLRCVGVGERFVAIAGERKPVEVMNSGLDEHSLIGWQFNVLSYGDWIQPIEGDIMPESAETIYRFVVDNMTSAMRPFAESFGFKVGFVERATLELKEPATKNTPAAAGTTKSISMSTGMVSDSRRHAGAQVAPAASDSRSASATEKGAKDASMMVEGLEATAGAGADANPGRNAEMVARADLRTLAGDADSRIARHRRHDFLPPPVPSVDWVPGTTICNQVASGMGRLGVPANGGTALGQKRGRETANSVADYPFAFGMSDDTEEDDDGDRRPSKIQKR